MIRKLATLLIFFFVIGTSSVLYAAHEENAYEDDTKAPFITTKQVIPVDPDDPPEPTPDPPAPPVVVTPVYIEPEPSVTSPDASTSWEHGDRNCRVEWNGLDGNLVKIELYRNGSLVDEFAGWTDNNGSYTRYEAIPSSWGSGTGFRIRVVDNVENDLWSDRFQISAPITVTSPDYGTRWATGQGDIRIIWAGAEGSEVKIELYRDGSLLEDLTGWIPNTGSFQLNRSVPASWGTGNDYQIVVTDNLQNRYTSSNFSIDPIWVQEPYAGTVWYKGRIPGTIRWSGGGAAVKVYLYRGSTLVHNFSSSWVDNNFRFNSVEPIPESWQDSPMYRIKVESMDSYNNTVVGWSDYFEIRTSNDIPAGADPILNNQVSSEIEEPGDIDHWSFNAEKDYIYEIDVSAPVSMRFELVSRNGSSVYESELSGDEIEWYCHHNGEYLVKISAAGGMSTGDYSVEVSRRRPPEKQRTIQFGGFFGTVMTDLSDVVTGGYGINVAYLPVRYLEAGASMYGVNVSSDAITSAEDVSMLYMGGYGGFRSPELNRISLRGGAGYYGMISNEEVFIKHEYSDYVDAVNDGLRYYGGIDYKIAYDHFGYAVYLQLQHFVLQGSSNGITSIGLSAAF